MNTIQNGCKFYMKTLQNFETNPEIAYLHLITVGEILANYFEYDENEILEQDDIKPVLNKMEASLCFNDKEIKIVTNRIFSIKKKFVITFNKLVNDKFFIVTEVLYNDWGKLTKENFEKCMKASYDLRSRYVHSGFNFGNYISLNYGGMRGEILKRQINHPDKKLKKLLQKIPTFIGLERIVRYALLRFIHLEGFPLDPCLNDK